MEGQVSSVTFKTTVLISFLIGVVMGYKAKEWRLWWVRRKRDWLKGKLKETEKKIDSM